MLGAGAGADAGQVEEGGPPALVGTEPDPHKSGTSAGPVEGEEVLGGSHCVLYIGTAGGPFDDPVGLKFGGEGREDEP